MTERSWLWDGVTTGDATYAPYAKAAFNRWFLTPKNNDNSDKVFVLPNYLDDLLVTPSEGELISTLSVSAGAAVFNNFIYVLDEVKYFQILQLSVASYRYDSLLLRITQGDTPKVRLVLVQGDESNSYPPTPYTVEQDESGTWEVEIARVLVDSSAYTLDGTKIEIFLNFLPVDQHVEPAPYNLNKNSEWLAISGSTFPVEYVEDWATQGLLVTPTATTRLAPQSRGYALNSSAGGAETGFRTMQSFDGTLNNRITIEGTIKLNDSTTRVEVRLLYLRDINTYSTEKERDIIGLNTEDTHVFKRTFSVPSDTTLIWVYIFGTATTNDYDIGQILLSPGYFTGSRRPFEDYIGIKESITDASWNGDAKSTGVTTINLSASFGGLVPQHVKGLVLNVRCRDSASAGGTGIGIEILSYTSAWSFGSIIVDGITNNYWRAGQIIAYIDEPFNQSLSTNRGFRASVTATGAATLDAYIEIVGFIV